MESTTLLGICEYTQKNSKEAARESWAVYMEEETSVVSIIMFD
jgi:hypothetical protein